MTAARTRQLGGERRVSVETWRRSSVAFVKCDTAKTTCTTRVPVSSYKLTSTFFSVFKPRPYLLLLFNYAMAKSTRAHQRQKNNTALRARVFAPAEKARAERLSEKLMQIASQPSANELQKQNEMEVEHPKLDSEQHKAGDDGPIIPKIYFDVS